MAHTIVKFRKINSVKSNIQYLQNKTEHPEICYTCSTCSKKLWEEYAEFNQEAFKKSGQKGKCIEAHEFILVFPNEFYKLIPKENLLNEIVKVLKNRLGIEVYAAMHGSDQDSNNLHVHVMYMERKLEQEQDKIAKRNMYFNQEGKQVRAKKDAVDQDGNLLPGYTMVPKGECYGKKTWSAKRKNLRSKEFTQDIKQFLTNVINGNLEYSWAEGMEKREVYDRENSPYLPLQDTYKPLKYSNKEKYQESVKTAQKLSEDIVECNKLRIEYNDSVTAALMNGADQELLVEKRKKISKEIKENIEKNNQKSIKGILANAVNWIHGFLDKLFKKTDEKDLGNQIGSAEKQQAASIENDEQSRISEYLP